MRTHRRRVVAIPLLVAMAALTAGPVVTAAPAAAATGFTMLPIVGVRDSGPDNCAFGLNGLDCLVTIVLKGDELPTAAPTSIGVAQSDADAIVTIQANNDSGSRGWLAGHQTDRFSTCKIIIGASTSTELILQVGNLGPTCPVNAIHPGDKIDVTLFNPDGSAFGTQTTTATAPPPSNTPPNDPTVPLVTEVVPPYGPVRGGTTAEPVTGRVTVATGDIGTPEAAWFGAVATSDITQVDATHYSVVPPPSTAAQDNEGIAVQFADSVNGLSPQHCTVLLPDGCADQFMYLSEHGDTFTSLPLNFNWNASLASQASVASRACGVNGSTGTSTGLSIGGSVTGGPITVSANYGVSKSAAGIPETFVGAATFTVDSPISINVSLKGSVSGCEQIAIPDLAIPGIAGLYFVVGGGIEADLSLIITINKGTYSIGGSFIPGSNPGDVTGVTVNAACVDENGQPAAECVTTKLEASLTGTLAISPLWLQIGPDFANIGAGLTAQAIGVIKFPPLSVDGDICVAGNWVAQANFGPLSINTGGTWLGPFNIAGNGALCPLGDAGGGPASTSTGLASSANPSTPTQETSLTASVTPTPDGGTVSFTDNGVAIDACQSVAVDAAGNAPCAVTLATAGSHPIVATYSGNTGFAGSASTPLDQVVSDVPPPTATTTALSSSANPAALNQEVTYTASVGPTPDGGTVSFTDNGTAIDACQTVALDATGNAPCAVTYTTAGTHSIVATYSGTPAFAGSTATALDQVVSDATPPTLTTTALVSSANPSAVNEAVTYTASVSPVPDGGTVSFADNGAPIAECPDAIVDNHGEAACTVTYTDAASHPIVATYNGDPAFSGSVSSTLEQVVGDATPQPIPTATGLASTANPSALNEAVTYTASVSPVPDGGTVSFTDDGAAIAECPDAVVDAAGEATCTVIYTAAASHPIVATYSGDAAFAGSVSSTLDQVVSDTTPPPETSTGLASSVNPSAPGEPVTLTASVIPTPDGGTVSFTDEGGPIADCQAVAVDASGDATCVVTYSDPGTHAIVATYSGDAAFAGSTSTTLEQAVTTPAGFTATATPSTATRGDVIQLSATGLPDGPASTVTFVSGETVLCEALVADGAAQCSTADDLPPGDYPVTATFSGPPELKATTSFSIAQDYFSIEASATPDSASYPNTVQLTVTGLDIGATGTVTFTSGSTVLCIAAVYAAHYVNCSVPAGLTPYEYPVTATYSGDANYAGATATTSFTITKREITIKAKATPTPGSHGHRVRFAVRGIPVGATGTATFTVGSTTLCSAIVYTTGAVSCVTAPDLPKGTYVVLATYSGDANYAGSTDTTHFRIRNS